VIAATCISTAGEFSGLDERWVPSAGAIRDVQKLVRIYAERGLGIVAWA